MFVENRAIEIGSFVPIERPLRIVGCVDCVWQRGETGIRLVNVMVQRSELRIEHFYPR